MTGVLPAWSPPPGKSDRGGINPTGDAASFPWRAHQAGHTLIMARTALSKRFELLPQRRKRARSATPAGLFLCIAQVKIALSAALGVTVDTV
jgi:hypothetical protein